LLKRCDETPHWQHITASAVKMIGLGMVAAADDWMLSPDLDFAEFS